jgi:N-methylhydantoinase A/oxoprolinase/acetone carboxylase beta subunit
VKRIGIDVGGTNTDAVLLHGDRVVHAVKTPTTPDVTTGITRALAELVKQAPSAREARAVMIGTTHFTNAVVQRRDLGRVAAVRIGLPSGASLPPFVDWPEDLAALVRAEVVMLEGGHEFDGRPLVPFDGKGMRAAARRIREAGIRSVAIASVFSPLNASCEEEAAAIVREECPGVAVTMSHRLGRIGLLERENATLLNACLIELARRTTRAFTEALRASGIAAPLYLTQNDGTVMLAEVAEEYPVYSFASGPTNSMRGAAFLSKRDEALVVDVGGTTTDIGSLRHGFPREANSVVEIGGVRTLFRMPDLLSLGLGGGTRVATSPALSIGPASVGYRLTEQALVFGGDVLTVTDVAVAAGRGPHEDGRGRGAPDRGGRRLVPGAPAAGRRLRGAERAAPGGGQRGRRRHRPGERRGGPDLPGPHPRRGHRPRPPGRRGQGGGRRRRPGHPQRGRGGGPASGLPARQLAPHPGPRGGRDRAIRLVRPGWRDGRPAR